MQSRRGVKAPGPATRPRMSVERCGSTAQGTCGKTEAPYRPAERWTGHQKDKVMSKKDLIDAVAKDADLTKDKAATVVDAVIKHIGEVMKKGEEVRIPGFGTFKVSKRAARTGKNPLTKEPIKIPASNVPKFQAAKALKELLN